MKNTAFTIDTNIFMHYEYNMDALISDMRPIIEIIRQPNDTQNRRGGGKTCIVISEIIVHESTFLFNKNYSKLLKPLTTPDKKTSTFDRKRTKDLLDGLQKKIDNLNDIQYFIKKSGAQVLSYRGVTMDQLMNAYFTSEPPFSNTGRKKREFPDAIALFSMEQWRKKNKADMIAVSQDSDWEKFSAVTDSWYCERTVENAVAEFVRMSR